MLIDLGGQRFGKLVVIERAPSNRHGQVQWVCRCDCGTTKIAHGQSLRKGFTKSCGCFRREQGHARTQRGGVLDGRKHEMSGSAEYRTWHSMIERCTPNSKDAQRYLARNIEVCLRWRESFEAFFEDMGSRPSPKHSIERKDNAGDYSPENCVWATAKEQQRNTRRNRMLTVGERTQCIAAWAEEHGMPWDRLYTRVQRGWPTSRLFEPVRRSMSSALRS